MSRILAIDYGRKRCGIAVTDILQISANGLETVPTAQLPAFLHDYCSREDVEEIVVGLPRRLSGDDSESMRYIRPFMARLPQIVPGVRITQYDERFTSTLAHRAMIDANLPRSVRQQKPLADKTAAVILLTDYLQSKSSITSSGHQL